MFLLECVLQWVLEKRGVLPLLLIRGKHPLRLETDMRLRNLHRQIRRNQFSGINEMEIGNFTAEISTLSNASVSTKLEIPSTAWTGSNAGTAIYVTGGYLIVADAGVWASAVLG